MTTHLGGDTGSGEAGLRDALSALGRALGDSLGEVGSELRDGLGGLKSVKRELSYDLLTELQEAVALIRGDPEDAAIKQSIRAVKAEQTRAHLLAAARHLFAVHGYEATSVSDIAKAAGYTKGALYAHFTSKEDLLFALVAEAGTDCDDERGAADVILSLELYLYALRHPESRSTLVPMAQAQTAELARQVAEARGSGQVEPVDIDTAYGLAAISMLGAVFAQILPAEADVNGAIERVRVRLLSD